MVAPINPDPIRDWRPEHVPAALANGVVGLRVGPVPPLEGVAVVNGFVGPDPEAGVESLLPIPFPLAGDVVVNGAPISSVPGGALLREQRYDLRRGELHTALAFTAPGARGDIDILTACNRAFPTIVVQELNVHVDAPCQVELVAGVDATDPPGTVYLAELGDRTGSPVADGVLGWRSPGGVSACGIAYHVELHGGDGGAPRHERTVTDRMTTTYTVAAVPGRVYRLRQISSVVSDGFHSTPHVHALRLLGDACLRGFDALLEANAGEWADLWCGRVELCGAPRRWQAMADAAFYYLQASVHRSSACSTSPFGMSYLPDYHYYRGHVMWDIETFAVPPLLLTQPDAARALLRYRWTRLAAARTNAKSQGYTGAQFPWESSPRDGEEATPLGGNAPFTEHHVSMDVALAFARYVQATGDATFARDQAWPVLAEVARWIVSRANRTGRG